MRLIRNTRSDGRCKYALIRLDKMDLLPKEDQRKIEDILNSLPANLIEYGRKGTEEEHFVIKLKDIYAPAALASYSSAVIGDSAGNHQYAHDVLDLAVRAAHHPNRKRPD